MTVVNECKTCILTFCLVPNDQLGKQLVKLFPELFHTKPNDFDYSCQ